MRAPSTATFFLYLSGELSFGVNPKTNYNSTSARLAFLLSRKRYSTWIHMPTCAALYFCTPLRRHFALSSTPDDSDVSGLYTTANDNEIATAAAAAAAGLSVCLQKHLGAVPTTITIPNLSVTRRLMGALEGEGFTQQKASEISRYTSWITGHYEEVGEEHPGVKLS